MASGACSARSIVTRTWAPRSLRRRSRYMGRAGRCRPIVTSSSCAAMRKAKANVTVVGDARNYSDAVVSLMGKVGASAADDADHDLRLLAGIPLAPLTGQARELLPRRPRERRHGQVHRSVVVEVEPQLVELVVAELADPALDGDLLGVAEVPSSPDATVLSAEDLRDVRPALVPADERRELVALLLYGQLRVREELVELLESVVAQGCTRDNDVVGVCRPLAAEVRPSLLNGECLVDLRVEPRDVLERLLVYPVDLVLHLDDVLLLGEELRLRVLPLLDELGSLVERLLVAGGVPDPLRVLGFDRLRGHLVSELRLGLLSVAQRIGVV